MHLLRIFNKDLRIIILLNVIYFTGKGIGGPIGSSGATPGTGAGNGPGAGAGNGPDAGACA